tara:strand:- start:91 stop:396 length:306 start_codon:yes stop_codon:yes gene_type:complete
MTDEGYLFEMQRLAFEMEQVADKYGVKDRTINVIITGLIDESATGLQKIKAIYSYSLDSKEELEQMVTFLRNTWDDDHDNGDDYTPPNIDDLLDGTGIFLN